MTEGTGEEQPTAQTVEPTSVQGQAQPEIPPEPPPAEPKGKLASMRDKVGLSAFMDERSSERKLVSLITEPVPIGSSSDLRELDRRNAETDLLLKRWLSTRIIRWMGRQLIVANLVFVAYAWFGLGWEVPAPAISAWLGATVIQIIGIVYIIARYLFPADGANHGGTTHTETAARSKASSPDQGAS